VVGANRHYYHRTAADSGSSDEGGSVHPNITMALWPVAIAGIFLVALYGGYFGAGIGILMIGALSFISRGDIRHVVALKNFLTLCMRGMAVLVLVLQGNVNWKYGAPMAIGGLIGGYIGGNNIASREPHACSLYRYCDRFCRSAYFFWKVYGPAVSHIGVE
jgi:Predicted permeases